MCGVSLSVSLCFVDLDYKRAQELTRYETDSFFLAFCSWTPVQTRSLAPTRRDLKNGPLSSLVTRLLQYRKPSRDLEPEERAPSKSNHFFLCGHLSHQTLLMELFYSIPFTPCFLHIRSTMCPSLQQMGPSPYINSVVDVYDSRHNLSSSPYTSCTPHTSITRIPHTHCKRNNFKQDLPTA